VSSLCNQNHYYEQQPAIIFQNLLKSTKFTKNFSTVHLGTTEMNMNVRNKNVASPFSKH